jgi:signal transduction histidine kinase
MQKANSVAGLVSAYTSLGAIRSVMKDYDGAESLYLKALRLSREYRGDENDNAQTVLYLRLLNNLGVVYREKGNFEKASEINLTGIELAKSNPDYVGLYANLLNNHGELHRRLKNYTEAEKLLFETLKIRQETGNKQGESAALFSLGKLSEETAALNQAIDLYRSGMSLATGVGSINLVQIHAEKLYQIFKNTGQADSALRYIEVYAEYNKRQNENNVREDLTRQELINQFRILEQQHLEQHSKERMQSLILLILVLAVICLILFTLILVWKKHQATKSEMIKIKEESRQLQDTNATKDKLFSIISHDLRGPIGSLNSGLEILSSGKVKDDKSITRFLEEMNKASKTTFDLVENLLKWSRAQTNSIRINSDFHNVYRVIKENVDICLASAQNKHIQLEIRAEENLIAYFDRETINVVIRNLLSNAIKFTPENGFVVVSARAEGEKVEIEIKDTGIGMSRDVVNKLFTSISFTTYGTNGEKGTGLGLALCSDFVRRNGGELKVKSSPGEGTRFSFCLPAAAGENTDH